MKQSLHSFTCDMVHDLRNIGWDATQLMEICKQEVKTTLAQLNITPTELYEKVQRAYVSKLRDGFKEE